MKAQPLAFTSHQEKILEQLALYEVLTSRDLAKLCYGEDTIDNIRLLNPRLMNLRTRHHLTNRVYFIPENYKGKGNNPNAWGLSELGVEFANEQWPNSNPKLFSASHSPHTIEHDLKRARTHIAIQNLSDKHGWALGWKKGGYHLVKPDDMFEITKEKTAHFFLEVEHKKKDFDALYEKLKPYITLHATNDMKQGWGFKYYNVVIPMRDREATDNLLTHFQGKCNCIDPKMKYLHKNSPFRLNTDKLLFTTYDEITQNTGGKILQSTDGQTRSFLDIVS